MRSLEKSGVISRVFWPTKWASPAMFCRKPNSDKVRMVTDFTKLKKRVKRSVHEADKGEIKGVELLLRRAGSKSRLFSN